MFALCIMEYLITNLTISQIPWHHYWPYSSLALSWASFSPPIVCSQDGSVKLWDYVTGEQLSSLDFTADFQQTTPVDLSASKEVGQPEVGSEVKVDSDAIMSRTKGLADVKCLACCQKNKYAALSFDRWVCVVGHLSFQSERINILFSRETLI